MTKYNTNIKQTSNKYEINMIQISNKYQVNILQKTLEDERLRRFWSAHSLDCWRCTTPEEKAATSF